MRFSPVLRGQVAGRILRPLGGDHVPSGALVLSTARAEVCIDFLFLLQKTVNESLGPGGETETTFYKLHRHLWVARVGMAATSPVPARRFSLREEIRIGPVGGWVLFKRDFSSQPNYTNT